MRAETKTSYPVAEEQEMSLLGSILVESSHLLHVRERLKAAEFGLSAHRAIFVAMCAMDDAGKAIEIQTLRRELEDAKQLEAIGGTAYLFFLAEGIVKRPSVDDYVDHVKEKARLREICVAGERAATLGRDQSRSAADVAAEALDSFEQIMADTPRSGLPSIEKQVHAAWQELEAEMAGERSHYFSYGIDRLDKLIGGLTKSEMTVLGGRPGQGKSCLATQMIVRHCGAGTPVYIASPEMTASQILKRIVASVARLPFDKLRRPEQLTDEEKKRANKAYLEVSMWPLWIEEEVNLTADDICLRAKSAKRKHGVEIVIVDYLQKLRFSNDAKHRFQEVGDAAKKFTNFAKAENVAMLVLSSLTEPGDKRRNEPPTMADLRQSGDIKYEAHTILLLHRLQQDDSDDLESSGQIIVAKARNDQPGLVYVDFDQDRLQFQGAERRLERAS